MFEDVDVEGIPQDPLGVGELEDVWVQRLVDSAVPQRSLVDQLEESSGRSRILAAERYRLLDAMRCAAEGENGAVWTEPDSLEWRSLVAEVAAALEIHERSARVQLELARQLAHTFSATLEAMARMSVSERHARILVEQSVGLREEFLASYEQRLLPYASVLVPARFERMARTIRASLDAEAMVERHREACGQRRVALEPGEDGMAWYGAWLSAEDAYEAAAVVEAIAESLNTEGEPRTLAQIKADVFRDLFVDAAGVVPPAENDEPLQDSPRARRRVSPGVFVHVPALTALGRSNAFGLLEGYGPIDAETARKLAGRAERWIRILTDPETGVICSYGRARYRVPEDLRQALRIRDGVCRFVGCTRPAVYCDLDHTVAWEHGGQSDLCNLAYLCKAHHRLKHGSPWNVTQPADGSGTLRWTSPRGRTYRTYADTVLPPPTRTPPGAPPLVQTEWLAAADDALPPF